MTWLGQTLVSLLSFLQASELWFALKIKKHWGTKHLSLTAHSKNKPTIETWLDAASCFPPLTLPPILLPQSSCYPYNFFFIKKKRKKKPFHVWFWDTCRSWDQSILLIAILFLSQVSCYQSLDFIFKWH